MNAANVEVFDMSESKHELKGMGTTVVCAIVKDGQAYIAHAGDSRAYILKNGKIFQITTDHSIVQDLLDKGKITSEQALNHPNKNIITRAVGVDKNIEIDFDQIDLDDDTTLLFVPTVYLIMYLTVKYLNLQAIKSIMRLQTGL